MSALVVGGVIVPVARGGASRTPVEIGEHARAFDGSPVSDVSAVFDELPITTAPMSPAAAASLRTALRGVQPVPCSGDLLGAAVDCDVVLGDEQGVKARDGVRWVISFTLRVS